MCIFDVRVRAFVFCFFEFIRITGAEHIELRDLLAPHAALIIHCCGA
jgi:hypothetical protein